MEPRVGLGDLRGSLPSQEFLKKLNVRGKNQTFKV